MEGGVGSATLDAGAGNEFRNARASWIAGPCPFTRIEADHFSQGGQTITASARAWSDTTTFMLEAEVTVRWALRRLTNAYLRNLLLLWIWFRSTLRINWQACFTSGMASEK